MTGKDLKNSILQFAIQGKLVPQDPNDEPASVLLAKIRKEKEKLVREKKLKKKDLETTPVTDEEKPFEIPESWEWCRLGEISTYNSKKKKINAANASPDIWELDLEDIEKGGRIISMKSVRDRGAIGDKTIFKEGDILYSKLRPYLQKILVAPKDGICTSEIVPFTCYGGIDSVFIVKFLKSGYVDKYINATTFGIKMPRVSPDIMCSLVLPLPPLAEQKRIVAKIDELMPLVEEYDEAQAKLDKLNSTFPEALKMSILQEAIQGKLVPQDPNDEPASILLTKIRKEKEKLVREKKLKKKDQETTPVTDEEKPFEIPESWEWCRLGEMCFLMDGIKKTGKNVLLDARYLRGKKEKEIIESGRFVNMGKTIILVDGENSGEVFVVPHEGYMGSTFKELLLLSSVFNKYLLFIFLFYQPLFRNSKKGEAIPHLNKELFKNLPIGIPPLAEQKRIVEKIEEIMAKIEKLKNELS